MNYKITFSTYVNATKTYTRKPELVQALGGIADSLQVAGFNLADSTGYYLKTVEPSHALTLFDIAPETAREFALAIKRQFKQLEVILEQLPPANVEFI
ncbi:MAG: hypothetical protein ACR2FM_05080 [Candidatus Saccharimonadales bacterium]